MLYLYPKQAYFGKTVAKSKIYKHATVGTALKEKFVTQIEKIVWQYKLAPETTNLTATSTVPEIQIFGIWLKGNGVDELLLRTIDRAIPFPIVYQIYRGDEVKVKASYKRPSDADRSKWVTEAYVESDWMPEATQRKPLPVALNLSKLYEQMLEALMPDTLPVAGTRGSMREQMERIEAIRAKERAYDKLKAKRDKEKQFNKKVKLNEELHALKQEMDILIKEKDGEISDE
jgi:hypothetical protein